MKNILCLGIFFFLLTAGIISCKKDDDTVTSDKVTLLSFGPSGSKPGDKIRFIGNNLNKVTAIELKGAVVAAAAFNEQAADHITLTVPQETEKGTVTLKAPEGDIISKTVLNLNVPVTVTTVPATAVAGQNITIKGTFVNWITRITFGNDAIVTEFVSKSVTELVVKVPVTATTGTLIFHADGTEPVDIESDEVLEIK
ncbi:hypothetical protein [Chitinophaga arvensicola]|uniref:IPT/TIG domain-containing protein n=1 Tax=Chitinophaga arvensicola TaxID=29529 RepID=A0A1I0SDK0_9BACT|nr:hypothetical protein [Chitinophaga arvensicola]SEW56329.1 hypothetical protein SAMN04488122_6628 [Chitinophaga arvensicola]